MPPFFGVAACAVPLPALPVKLPREEPWKPAAESGTAQAEPARRALALLREGLLDLASE